MAARPKGYYKAYDAARSVKRAQDRAERKLAGLCAICGEGPPAPGRVACERCLGRQVMANITWKDKHPGVAAIVNRAHGVKLKLETMQAYGGHCTCCGETNIAFLCIDHINGDGSQHRRETFGKGENKGGGATIYSWLRRKGYPSGFQVLCCNCNFAKQIVGVCPHQVSVLSLAA